MSWSWKDAKELATPKTPSLLFNNLSWSSGRGLAYVNKNQVVVVPGPAAAGKSLIVNTQQMVNVTQAKYIFVGEAEYLAILSTTGFQIWTDDGKQMVHFLPLSSITQCAKGDYCRGVVGMMGCPTLCVGLSNGSIVVCNFDGRRLDVDNVLSEHQAPITHMASSSTAFASADDTGNLVVWDSGSFEVLCRFAGQNMPCSSVATRADTLVAGYVDGKVRLYHIQQQALMCEINAHARAVNAVCMHPGQDIFVTCGEDSFVNVWTTPSRGKPKPELILSKQVKNGMLTGVQFASDGSTTFAAAAYDVDKLSYWTT